MSKKQSEETWVRFRQRPTPSPRDKRDTNGTLLVHEGCYTTTVKVIMATAAVPCLPPPAVGWEHQASRSK
jgi:hypothetical protein